MKKFRNLVIGGIGTRMFNLILITVIVITSAYFAVTQYQSRMLSRLTAETSLRQQEATSGIISETMATVTRRSMERTTEMEVRIVDDMFQDIKARVTLISRYATEVFANPSDYSPKPWADPDAASQGRLSAMMLWAEGVDREDPDLQAKAGFLANFSDLMLSLCGATELDNIYMGVPEGLFLSVSRTPRDWFTEDGSQKSYDPRTRYWYTLAAEAGELVFSDLEIDATTGELSVTCAMPVYNPDGSLAAVVGADLFLHAMENVVGGLVQDGGYSWIVNREGHVVYSPNPEILQATASTSATDLREGENRDLTALVSDAMEKRTDVRVIDILGEDYYMVGMPVETMGWALFSAFPKEQIDQVEVLLLESYDQITGEARTAYQEKIRESRHSTWVLIALLTVAAATGAILLGKRIVKPLNTITKRIASIDESQPVFEMEDGYRTGDEIEVLAESFANLSQKTVEYVSEVRRVTAEKERIVTELSMAKRIQEGMLPNIFPPFPDRPEFDLYATMTPAKEVGGDFYDFYLIDGDHLALVMADVSGKGIPGALFMMASKIILQSCAMQGGTPAEILTKTNAAICSNNSMQMFVTVWFGILEISSGKLTAANGGHEYPVIGRTGGDFELYKDKHGFVLGGMEGVRYKQYELQLHPGDRLFLYTDGVPEATDANEELFGTERMIRALNSERNLTPERVIQNVHDVVNQFVGDAEQFDDLTMLCLEYKGL